MSPYRMSKIEQGVRTVIQFTEAFNQHDVPAMMQLIAKDCLFEHFEPAPDGTTYAGKNAIESFWHDYFRQTADASIEIEAISGLREHCIMRWRLSWTDYSGDVRYLRCLDLFKVRDGAIYEQLSYVKAQPHNSTI